MLNPQQPQPSHPYFYPMPPAENGISLFDLWAILTKKKMVIFSVTLVVIIIATIYALITPSTYRAEAFLLPPDQINVEGMNLPAISLSSIGDQGNKMSTMVINFKSYTPDSVYQRFIVTFKSKTQRVSYFKKHNLQQSYCDGSANSSSEQMAASCYTKAFESFDRDLQIHLPKKKNALSALSVSFEFNDAALSAKHLNDYVESVRTQTIENIYREISNQINISIAQTDNTIESKYKMAVTRNTNEIFQLNEDIAISKLMGIKRPDELTGMTKPLVLPQSQQSGLPVEFLGYEYLEAKRDKLLKRKNFDPFIEGLTELQEVLNRLKSIKVDMQSFDTVKVDLQAETPLNRTKPKRKLILILGTMLGLMLGIFVAFIHHATQSHREKQTATP